MLQIITFEKLKLDDFYLMNDLNNYQLIILFTD